MQCFAIAPDLCFYYYYSYYPLQIRQVGLHEMRDSLDSQRCESPAEDGGESADDCGGNSVSDTEFSPLAGGRDARPRDLLLECARAVSQGDWQRSARMIDYLSQRVSKQGNRDADERVLVQFLESLAARVARAVGGSSATSTEITLPAMGSEEMEAAYLTFNQVTPFVRFAHLTANQAILEAVEVCSEVHIVDFEIMQGLQWPPLMQALLERAGGPPSLLRISAVGSNADLLQHTGVRLSTFARSLRLPFEFNAIINPSSISIKPDEALAINCVLHLPTTLDIQRFPSLFAMVQSLHPRVVTLAEREASFNQTSNFMDRFADTLRHYSPLFESLEATLPPSSAERMRVESTLFKQEIMSMLTADQGQSSCSYPKWRDLFASQGLIPVPLSTFAIAQAKLLLRLHYPSEGYQLHQQNLCLLLGWQDTSLFAVSAWNLPSLQISAS